MNNASQLRHHLMTSGVFDADWYLSNYPDVALTGLDPVEHFLRVGHMLYRSPGPSFDPKWYASVNDDVIAANMDPLLHFLEHGRHEERPGRKQHIDLQRIHISVSIVIPTWNRAEKLPHLVEALCSNADGLDYELVIVNDGSTDNTHEVLTQLERKHANLSVVHIDNQGAGTARNHGAASASKDIVLFIGDDIVPSSCNFISAHTFYHQENKRTNFAVLGKVDWPQDSTFEITPVMRHIQGPGGEQFGYADMGPYRAWDWRFFYTCNVSVKRNVVSDWKTEGFLNSFRGCGFEDNEFAYRMSKTHGAFNVFFIDDSVGHHYHRHTVASFVRRQRLSGSMAHILLEAHPELSDQCGVGHIQRALGTPGQGNLDCLQHDLALADSIVRLADTLESEGILSTEPWHKALLHAAFKISMEMGYLVRAATPVSNYAAAVAECVDAGCALLERELPRNQWGSLGLNSQF